MTGRKGREVIVNDDFRFSLDKVTTLFTPAVGDFLYMDALVEVDAEADDYSGEIIDVSRVRWVGTAGAVAWKIV